jgi:hypothetical protein
MQLLTPLYQETVVGDILDDRVLEDVGWLGEESQFIDNL